MKWKLVAAAAVGSVVVAWGWLYTSERGLLVWSGTENSRSTADFVPAPATYKVCYYFTGTGVVTTRQQLFGLTTPKPCNRWYSIRLGR